MLLGIAFGILSVLFSVALIVCLVTSLDDHPLLKILSGLASFFAGLLWFISVTICILGTPTVEKEVENQLAAGLKKV